MFGGSDGEAQVRAVVEGVEPWFEAFGRGETADEMRVAGFEFRERPFGLVRRGFEEGVAVAGEHYVVAEGDHDGEHGGGDDHAGDHARIAGVRDEIRVDRVVDERDHHAEHNGNGQGHVCARNRRLFEQFVIQSFKMAKLALWPFGSQIRSL